MNKWTITTQITGKKRSVEVRLYNRAQDLKSAVTKYAKRWGDESTDGNFLAICHNFRGEYVDKNGELYEFPLTNIIRLSREHLTPAIVAHEFIHAVEHMFSIDYADKLYKEGEPNEDFAYLYGELFGSFWPMVHNQVNLYPPPSTDIERVQHV